MSLAGPEVLPTLLAVSWGLGKLHTHTKSQTKRGAVVSISKRLLPVLSIYYWAHRLSAQALV